MQMEGYHYFVMWDADGWKIQCEGETSEGYATRREAMRRAVDLAHLDQKNGRHAKVVVQGRDSKFRDGWTAGRDPYPPRL